MPGFSNNSQQRAGNTLGANATGSVRIPLEPYANRFPYTGNSHVADIDNFRNNGVPMPVSGTGGGEATCVHVASLSALDEVYLWASNKGTANAQLTLSYVSGGVQIDGQTAAQSVVEAALLSNQRIITTIRGKAGLQLVYPGIPHTNNDAIFAISSNTDMNICGFVMRRFRESPTDINQGFDGQE
jgi:hypothetical protein|tara:strand:- start:2047 stop:2601 length:555 start_codon:yes stop_codon:yes gene_type:complete